MSGTRRSRSPNQWQEGPPGWNFDGWGVGRGGRNHDPDMPLRATGVERVAMIAGWSTAGLFALLAGLTNNTLLGLIAIFVSIGMVASKGAVRRWRTRRGSGGT